MRVVLIAIALCSLLGMQHVRANDCKHYKIGVHFNLYHHFVDTGFYYKEGELFYRDIAAILSGEADLGHVNSVNSTVSDMLSDANLYLVDKFSLKQLSKNETEKFEQRVELRENIFSRNARLEELLSKGTPTAEDLLTKATSCNPDNPEFSGLEVECEIMKIKEEIASNQPHRKKGNECLDLVVSTEMHWHETEYANGKRDFTAYLELANILQEHGIKMSLSLGVQSVPSWVADTKYANDQLEDTHDLRYKPDSTMWKDHAKPWIDAVIDSFSSKEHDYLGKGKRIEEIMISNEVMYTHTPENSYKSVIEPLIDKYPDISCVEGQRCSGLDKELTALLHQWYKYVKTEVQKRNLEIPVTWRIAHGALGPNQEGNPYTGIVLNGLVDNDEHIPDFFADNDNKHIPDFFAINVYEQDDADWNGDNWYTFPEMDSDFYNTAINPVKDFSEDRFIYFSEFGKGADRKKSLPIERVILRTKKDGVTHWAFFGWNVGGDDNITPEEKKGLKTAFDGFFCDSFPDWSKVDEKKKGAILELCSLGVIKGHDDGTLKPDEYINRAQFAKMIYLTGKLLELDFKELSENSCHSNFSDVTCEEWTTTWYTPFILKLAKNYVVKGYPNGEFKPGKPISFAEMAKMVTLGVGLLENNDPTKSTNEKTTDKFWFKQFVDCAKQEELLPEVYGNDKIGNDKILGNIPFEELDKDENAVNREQTAQMIYKAYKVKKDNNPDSFVCQ